MNKNVISADDPQALEKLQARLEKLEAKQKEMRAVNAYYRKHKTLDGCPGLPPTGIERLKAKMSQYRTDKPYLSYELSSNNAEIRRNKDNGFHWAPSIGVWQRQLNDNAVWAADGIKDIWPDTGEKPSDFQHRAREEAAAG